MSVVIERVVLKRGFWNWLLARHEAVREVIK